MTKLFLRLPLSIRSAWQRYRRPASGRVGTGLIPVHPVTYRPTDAAARFEGARGSVSAGASGPAPLGQSAGGDVPDPRSRPGPAELGDGPNRAAHVFGSARYEVDRCPHLGVDPAENRYQSGYGA